MSSSNKISFCGSFPGTIGGTTILVDQMYQGLSEKWEKDLVKVDYTTTKGLAFFKPFVIVFKTIIAMFSSGIIIVNVSKRGFETLILPLLIFRVFTKSIVLIRYFGGDADSVFLGFPRVSEILLTKLTKKGVCILTETIQNMDFFENKGFEVFQLTNCRPFQKAPNIQNNETSGFRLLFISQLKVKKGVNDVIAAVKDLDNVSVDFYGPLLWDIDESVFNGANNVRYKGIIPLGESFNLMQRYNALIFPSTYEGESHAGVIIEAYSSGLPVIAYRWRAIPEIVLENRTGLLSECNDIGSLKENIKILRDDIKLRVDMSQNCFQFYKTNFTTAASIERLEVIVNYLVGNSDLKPSKWQLIRECE